MEVSGQLHAPAALPAGTGRGYTLYTRLGVSHSANKMASAMNSRCIHTGVLLQYSLHARRDKDSDCAVGT